MKEFKEIKVRKSDIKSYGVAKSNDVLLVIMEDGKVWVCDLSTKIQSNDGFVTLKLAIRGKSE